MSKGFKVTFSMNLGISFASKLAFEGKLPTTGEILQMGAESFVGALVIDKVADLLSLRP
ncbi:hypothetical protein [Paenibacillus sp. UNC499MF]|uniref:hypothetical protein n=1 Tax=Paenibacillus sp. UNC499MF TaxID=1502751 RepID=UPI0008A08D16|nr:hypothetical protein [Paenibacillus sp. UNC499MF]SEG61274.1 hypothetical protein SAMN02799616_03775 [Paenibacillus sp. UNC499MF]